MEHFSKKSRGVTVEKACGWEGGWGKDPSKNWCRWSKRLRWKNFSPMGRERTSGVSSGFRAHNGFPDDSGGPSDVGNIAKGTRNYSIRGNKGRDWADPGATIGKGHVL